MYIVPFVGSLNQLQRVCFAHQKRTRERCIGPCVVGQKPLNHMALLLDIAAQPLVTTPTNYPSS